MNQVFQKWLEIKRLIEDLEIEVLKNARGNSAAGKRMRVGLRTLKKMSHDLQMTSTRIDKTRRGIRQLHRLAREANKY